MGSSLEPGGDSRPERVNFMPIASSDWVCIGGGGGGVSNNIYTSNSRLDNYHLSDSVPQEQREKNILEPNWLR